MFAVIIFCTVPLYSGSITGTVELSRRPATKVQADYGDRTSMTGKEMASIPTVVYIQGTIPGVPAEEKRHDQSIVQKNTQFAPSLLVVPRGSSVSFPNADDEYHNVFSYSKTRRFDLGRYPKGESKSVSFDKPGVVKIYCEIHPWMRAAVIVVDNPYHTMVDEQGKFTIENVPPGIYDVVIWNMDEGARIVKADVPADGEVMLSENWEGEDEPTVEISTLHVRMAEHHSDKKQTCKSGC